METVLPREIGAPLGHPGRSLSGALDRPEPSDPAARAPIRTSAPYTLYHTLRSRPGGDSPSGPQSGTATNHGGTEKTSGTHTSMRAYYRTHVILNTTVPGTQLLPSGLVAHSVLEQRPS